jgi:murein L,D-transpeptidase YcbB/YkuD
VAGIAVRVCGSKKIVAGVLFVLLLSVVTGCCLGTEAGTGNVADVVRELIRGRIEAGAITQRQPVSGEAIYSSVVLPTFYERRAYVPAWIGDTGLTPSARDLVRAIRGGEAEGLRPEDYHLSRIGRLVERLADGAPRTAGANPRQLADLELLLTDAFLIYGSHLLAGRVNPVTIDSEWRANRREIDMAEVLESAVLQNAIVEALESLRPPQDGYARLKEALKIYRRIAAAGGWAALPEGPKLRKGDTGSRVGLLRERLSVTGDLKAAGPAGDVFDDELESAVIAFQRRFGLDADGVVGPATAAALNMSAELRVRQIELNLERWRWLPNDLGARHILINIANFELDVVEAGREVLTMRAIVGRDYRRTPVFSDRMSYLVLNPYWHVPPKIAVDDILPKVRKDPGYLVENGFRVFRGWGADAEEIDPAGVDWATMTGRDFVYRLRQDPGPLNALGRVKFMFPNEFDVYLHDTPARALFDKTVRTFSSGCIRIEKPIELAEYVLRGDAKWTREAILEATDKRLEQTVRLPEQIPIHLLYWTAWVDGAGVVHFRDDIYGRDHLLDAALAEKPPI